MFITDEDRVFTPLGRAELWVVINKKPQYRYSYVNIDPNGNIIRFNVMSNLQVRELVEDRVGPTKFLFAYYSDGQYFIYLSSKEPVTEDFVIGYEIYNNYSNRVNAVVRYFFHKKSFLMMDNSSIAKDSIVFTPFELGRLSPYKDNDLLVLHKSDLLRLYQFCRNYMTECNDVIRKDYGYIFRRTQLNKIMEETKTCL